MKKSDPTREQLLTEVAELRRELESTRRGAREGAPEVHLPSRATLEEAQRLEALGRLAGGVAHDFNNLLTAIIGHAELLIDQMPVDDPQRPRLEAIHRAGRRGGALTGQLLAFSRRQMLQRKEIDLNQAVLDFAQILGSVLPAQVQVNYRLEPNLCGVKADPTQLEQVVLNLIVNAGEAMPDGGTLSLASTNVVLDETDRACMPEGRAGSFIRFSVSDQGDGIASDAMEHIFEPFYTTKESGTGLGLSVVHGIVKQHDGWLEVETTPAKGTTFHVYLPACLARAQPHGVEFLDLNELRGDGEAILLVEDEEALRELSAIVLRDAGYRVFEAGSVCEANRVFDENQGEIQLVFSDVVLPDRTGVDLVDDIHQLCPELPVILTSGYADHRSRWATIEEKGYPFLRKPYTPTELLLNVREVLG